jgi:hypothetical protein
VIDEAQFDAMNWTSVSLGAWMVEEMPPNMPESRDQGFANGAKVDADPASDSVP